MAVRIARGLIGALRVIWAEGIVTMPKRPYREPCTKRERCFGCPGGSHDGP